MEGGEFMITAIAWILLIMVSIILFCALAALFWKPEPAVEKKNNQVSGYQPQILSEEEKEKRSLKRERYLEEMNVRWQNLKPVMERMDLNDAIVFHWKGLHGKKKVLFSLMDEEAGKAFFEAVSALNDSSLIPDPDFMVFIPLIDDPDAVSLEMLEWTRSQNILPDLVVRCRNGLHDMPGFDGIEALIGVGQKPSVLYEIRGDNAEADWMASLHAEEIMKPSWNEQAQRMVQAIRKNLPWQLRFELCFPFLYRHKIMKDLMTLYPETKEWFLPKVDKRGDQLYVSAYDETIVKQAETVIESSAKEHSVRLEKIRANRTHLNADPDGESYQMIENAIRASLQTDAVIPVLDEKRDNEEDYAPVETISFSPLMNGKRVSAQGAMLFYENVLRKGI